MSRALCIFSLAVALGSARGAHAGSHDFSLVGLGRPASNAMNDPVVANYRALAAELAFVTAPRILAGADSLGASGFEFAFALNYTGISSDASWWNGDANAPVFESAVNGGSAPGGFWSPTLLVRKGLPFSADLGLSMAYLAHTSMVALGLDAKIGLFEAYLPTYLPDVALRVGFGHLVGSPELTQSTMEFDLLASYTFVYRGAFRLTPSLGVGRLFVRTATSVLDATPQEVVDPADQTMGPGGSLYQLPGLGFGKNHLTRVALGIHAIYGIAYFGYFLDLGLMPSELGSANHVSHTLKMGVSL